tara:strand:- start:187 stop:729 length:543 start_codon:yes stop_codon:yes gene_type:complete
LGTNIKKQISHNNDKYVLLYDNNKICQVVKNISLELNNYYSYKNDILIIGVLDGCMKIIEEFKKHLDFKYKIDYLSIKSYKGKKRGEIKFKNNDNIDFLNKNVIVFDDIIDSGSTILFLKDIIKNNNPKSIRVFSLLVKKNSKHLADWYGFEIKNKYVIGYGMDINNLFRDLKHIYIQEN